MIENELAEKGNQELNVEKIKEVISEYLQITDLNANMLNRLIERIEVSHTVDADGCKQQERAEGRTAASGGAEVHRRCSGAGGRAKGNQGNYAADGAAGKKIKEREGCRAAAFPAFDGISDAFQRRGLDGAVGFDDVGAEVLHRGTQLLGFGNDPDAHVFRVGVQLRAELAACLPLPVPGGGAVVVGNPERGALLAVLPDEAEGLFCQTPVVMHLGLGEFFRQIYEVGQGLAGKSDAALHVGVAHVGEEDFKLGFVEGLEHVVQLHRQGAVVPDKIQGLRKGGDAGAAELFSLEKTRVQGLNLREGQGFAGGLFFDDGAVRAAAGAVHGAVVQADAHVVLRELVVQLNDVVAFVDGCLVGHQRVFGVVKTVAPVGLKTKIRYDHLLLLAASVGGAFPGEAFIFGTILPRAGLCVKTERALSGECAKYSCKIRQNIL